MIDSQVLKRLDFPAYCVKVLDNGLVVISGGGGTSKTGVGNSIELGMLDYSNAAFAATLPTTADQLTPSKCALFQSIYTFEPNDAVMKFISFTLDRYASNAAKPQLNGKWFFIRFSLSILNLLLSFMFER